MTVGREDGQQLTEVVQGWSKGRLETEEARCRLERLGVEALARHLLARGLSRAELPRDKALLAQAVLMVQRPDMVERVRAPRTAANLLAGLVFEDDPADVVMRYAVARGDSAEVVSVSAGPWGPLRLQTELIVDRTDAMEHVAALPPLMLGDDLSDDGSPGEPGDPIARRPPDGPEEPQDPERPPGQGAKKHYKVDLKVVYWIPYEPNEYPVPSRKVSVASWEDPAKTTAAMRFAWRIMLATGNPTPPDSFPTRASWQTFVDSKQYRGLLHRKYMVCCPAGGRRVQPGKLVSFDAGYTPSPADVATAAELKAFHDSHQTPGSMAEGLASTDLAPPTWLAIPGVSDRLEDSIALLRDNGDPNSNDSYSKGDLATYKAGVEETGCLTENLTLMARVGFSHNLLHFILTGLLLRYQGLIAAPAELCCDGTFTAAIYHSAIPSMRIYLNNKLAYEYDMLTATPAELMGCTYKPKTYTFYGSESELTWALNRDGYTVNEVTSPGINNTNLTKTLNAEPGCLTAGELGDWWPSP